MYFTGRAVHRVRLDYSCARLGSLLIDVNAQGLSDLIAVMEKLGICEAPAVDSDSRIVSSRVLVRRRGWSPPSRGSDASIAEALAQLKPPVRSVGASPA